ncbi:MurR/RpiR family transcriptional regulator [Amaricoccus solimangrovi]|nr:MurR/RpiR family transcriptional regulator [Amaricoccus solimangrovi]
MGDSDTALNDKIRARADELTPGMRRVAEWISRNQEEVALRSLRQLAQRIGVSPPTITRLTRVLGYASFDELQQDCRKLLRSRSRYAAQADRLRHGTPDNAAPAGLLNAATRSAIDGLADMARITPDAALETAARRLLAARSVWFVGSMSSGAVARYGAYIASLAFPNWHEADLDSMASLATLGPEDMVFAIAISPYAARTITALEIARARGAGVIGISDSPLSPVSEISEQHFLVATDTPGFFSSYVQPFLLVETLIALAISRSGSSVGDRIAAVETALRASGLYWNRPGSSQPRAPD